MISILSNPTNFELEIHRCALLVIDMQHDFLDHGGFGESLGNDVNLLQSIVPAVAKVLHRWREQNALVVHTRECHLPDLTDCPLSKLNRGASSLKIGDHGPMGRLLIRGEFGSSIISEVAPIENEIVIDKPGKGAFYGTDLHEIMKTRGISQLVIMGVTTEVCVQTTMREANDRGYDCLLLEDCTASYFPHFKDATLEMLTAQGGIVGWTCPSERILEKLS